MLAFILELQGGLNTLYFKIQEDSLSYAGLLLFTGLYFVVDSVETPKTFTGLILVFLIISWGMWFSYKYKYLRVQKMEWDATKNDSKVRYVLKKLNPF